LQALNINEIQKLTKSQIESIKSYSLLGTIEKEKSDNTKNKKIVISFVFFDRDNPLFNLGEIQDSWYLALIDLITDISKITKSELRSGEYKNRYDPHNYIDDIEKLNYLHPLLIDVQREACQIRITKGKGRIHGFFIDNIYYIVFLDNHHNMYDSPHYEKSRKLIQPKTEYEILEEDYNELCSNLVLSKQTYLKIDEFMYKNCIECEKGEKFINDIKI